MYFRQSLGDSRFKQKRNLENVLGVVHRILHLNVKLRNQEGRDGKQGMPKPKA
jgi:hypothetical protein